MANLDRIVDSLCEARKLGKEPLGLDGMEIDYDTALRVQVACLRRLTAEGEAVGGWKIGMTSGPSRDKMGKDFRPFGYLLKSRLFQTGDSTPLDKILRCQIEPELCLIMGAPLRGHVSPEQAKAAVRAIAPAFEINEMRVPFSVSPQLLVADGLAQWGVVVGPQAPVRDHLSNTTVTLYQGNEKRHEVTPGDDMDDPFLSLARLARLLDEHGHGLEPGQVVITGSFCKAPVEQGTYRATFSGIGDVSFNFT